MKGMVLLLISAAILAIIFIPLINIWCVNVLFPSADIPYTLKTWFCALLLFSGAAGVRWSK